MNAISRSWTDRLIGGFPLLIISGETSGERGMPSREGDGVEEGHRGEERRFEKMLEKEYDEMREID